MQIVGEQKKYECEKNFGGTEKLKGDIFISNQVYFPIYSVKWFCKLYFFVQFFLLFL